MCYNEILSRKLYLHREVTLKGRWPLCIYVHYDLHVGVSLSPSAYELNNQWIILAGA